MAGKYGFDRSRISTIGGLALPGTGGQTYVTYVLLGINVIVWLFTQAVGGSTNPEVLATYGAMYAPLIANGEYWRLFTAMFLHVGLMHLLLNSLGLFIFGRQVEQVYGPVRFVLIYVLAGLAGSVASFLLNQIALGAGASGAIFGVLAALTAFLVARRRELGDFARQGLTGLLVLGAINLVFGFVQPGIDNWAHIGGFVGGFALGYVMAPSFRLQEYVGPFGEDNQSISDRNPLSRSWWIAPVVVAVLAVGVWVGSSTVPENPFSRISDAESLFEQGMYTEALDEIERALLLDRTHAQAYFLRGKILAELGQNRQAFSNITVALGLGLSSRDRTDAERLLDRLR